MVTRSRSFDVVVVGGGPAGASWALMLARRGVRVALVHRAGNHLSRVELVSGRARRLIQQHCPDFSEQSLPGVEINETISLWGTPEPVTWNAMYNPWGSALAVERAVFDGALRAAAERAGVLILDREIKSALRHDRRWQLRLEDYILTSDFLILATGARGRKLICRKSVGKPSQFALMAQLNTKAQQPRKALFLELGKSGWWYMLPNPLGGYFAGFCSDFAEASHWEKPLHRTFAKGLCDSRLLSDLLPDAVHKAQVTGCPAGPRRYERVTGEGWIAIGDAAFATDPLSGQGIEFAVDSASLAVRVLSQSWSPKEYEDAVHDYATNHEHIRALHLR